MRNRLTRLGALTVIAAVAAGLVAGPATASAKAPGKRLEVGLTRVQEDWLDLGAAGFSLGDQYVFIETLQRKGRSVGHSGGTCTVVGAKPPFAVMTYQCVATLRLPEGQVTLQGLLDATGPDDPQPFTLAITGGTGAYRDAGGDAILTLTNYDLRFEAAPKPASSAKHKQKRHS